MKPRVYLIIFLLLIPVQTGLFEPFGRIGLRPDISLAVLYAIGLLTEPIEGALAGIAVGLLQDISSAGLIGFSGISRGLTGMAAGFLGSRILDIQSPSNIIFLLVFSIADSIFAVFFLETIFGSFPIALLFFQRIIPQALVTALAGYALLRFATRRKVLAWMRRRELQKEIP